MSSERQPPKNRITRPALAMVILLCAVVIGLSVLLPARPVEPTETPGLTLDAAMVEAALQGDVDAASRAPESEAAERLRALYLAHGMSELAATAERAAYASRRRETAAALEQVLREAGEDGLGALRSEAAEELASALDGEMASERRDGFLGDFESHLERYGLLREGREVAPRFVTRALFKARWNAAMGVEPTAGLLPIELEAYWGWLALESSASPEQRLQALERLEQAYGGPMHEARGILLYLAGDGAGSVAAFEAALREQETPRLRNYALAAMQLSLQ